MRILIYSNHFLPHIGGIEFVTHNLATALYQMGHDVTVAVPTYDRHVHKLVLPYKQIFIKLFPKIPRMLFISLIILKEHLLQRYDIIHAQTAYGTGYEALFLKKILNIPLIITPQGGDIYTYEPLNYGLRLKKKVEKRLRVAIQCADVVTSASEKMIKTLNDLGYKHDHFTLYNGTCLSFFSNTEHQRTITRKEMNICDNKLVLISVGRNSPIKGYKILLEALRILKEKSINKEWMCILAGKNVHCLKNDIDKFSLQKEVLLRSDLPIEYSDQGIPMAPSKTIISLLCASDIFISPALSGGFELSTPDAFAAGLPVIIGDNNGSCDLIRMRNAGLIVRNGDADEFASAIHNLIKDDDLRFKYRKNALLTAPELDWHNIALESLKIYKSILGNDAENVKCKVQTEA
jgi:glycosyltransferase involved in cell wall biosynthesis